MAADLRFLIDECLSPLLARAAIEHRHFASHVTSSGLSSAADDVLADAALRTGAVLVTNNGRDFRRLYLRHAAHAGLVVIRPSVHYGLQLLLFTRVLEYLDQGRPIENNLVEIDAAGHVTKRPWPPRDD